MALQRAAVVVAVIAILACLNAVVGHELHMATVLRNVNNKAVGNALLVTAHNTTTGFTNLTLAITVPSDLQAVTYVTIRQGRLPAVGAVAIDFSDVVPISFARTGKVQANITILKAQLEPVTSKPGQFFIEVSTVPKKDRIRGQLHQVLLASNGSLYATLNGSQEITAGDPKGKGSAQLSVGTAVNGVANVTFNVIVSGLKGTITGLDVEDLDNGEIVIDFAPKVNFTDFNTYYQAKGTITVSTAESEDIFGSPTVHGINVRTSAYPKGAIRGALSLTAP